MIKNIELKKQNEINDIKAFRTLIQKCFETLDIHDNVTYQNYTPSKSSKNKFCNAELSQDEDHLGFRNKKSKITSQICIKDKKEIFNQIRNILYDINNNFTLVFKKQYIKKADNNKLSKEIKNQPAISTFDDLGNENFEKIQLEKFKENCGYDLCDNTENKFKYQNMPDEDSSEMNIDECNFENTKEADKKEIPVAVDEIKDIDIDIKSEDKQDRIIYEKSESEAEIEESHNFIEDSNLVDENELNNNKISLCEVNNFNICESIKNKNNLIINAIRETNGIRDKQKEENFKINKLEENTHINALEFLKNKNENNETVNYQKEYFSQNIDMKIENEEKKKLELLDNLESTSCEKSKVLNETINSSSKLKISGNIFNNEKDQYLEKIQKAKDNKSAKDYNLILVPNKNFINKNSRNRLTYNDSLNPNLFPWYYIKYSNFSPYDIVSIYKNFIKNEETYNKSILKINYPASSINPGNVYQEPYPYDKKGKNKILSSKINNNGIFYQENNLEYAHPDKTSIVNNEITTNNITHESTRIENLYCYCKNPGGNELLMIGCDNEENCPNNGWIHKDCDEDLAKLSKDVIENDDFKFLCKDCNSDSSKTKKGKKSYKKK